MEAEKDFKALIVHPHRMSEIKDFANLDDVCKYIGFQSEEQAWDTFECGIEGLGIVAHDQDKTGLEPNRLGINGTYAIVRMIRSYNSNGKIIATMFDGLTEQQARDARLSLSLTTLRQAQEQWDESELDA